MSGQRLPNGFAMTPPWLYEHPDATSYDLAVFGALWTYADGDGNDCFPSQERVAERARCSPDRAAKSIAHLVELGAITRTERPARPGKYAAHQYQFHLAGPKFPPAASGTERQVPPAHSGTVPPAASGTVPPAHSGTTKSQVTKNHLPRASSDTDKQFSVFWQLAVNRTGYGKARTAFDAVAANAPDLAVVLDGWREHNEAWATWPAHEQKYIPHPATWLAESRWNDTPKQHREKPSKLERLDAITDALGQFDNPEEALAALAGVRTTPRATTPQLPAAPQEPDDGIEDAVLADEEPQPEGTDVIPDDNRSMKEFWLSQTDGQPLMAHEPGFTDLAHDLINNDDVDYRDVRRIAMAYLRRRQTPPRAMNALRGLLVTSTGVSA